MKARAVRPAFRKGRGRRAASCVFARPARVVRRQAGGLRQALEKMKGRFTKILIPALMALMPLAARADGPLKNVRYTTADSARVVRLLRADAGKNDVLFYARQFVGKPYVAHTLETDDPERLVVNLRELDCTTLVETALALALTKRQGSDSFADFCRNLMRLRYRAGRMDGYLSRLHYFAWWMSDAVDKGLVDEVTDARVFTARMKVDNHYMSDHPDRYRMLKRHPGWTADIRRMEQAGNGAAGYYLPAAATGWGRARIGCIRDGDVIAIVTTKDGLDYSHLGFAVWGRDGKLHLLNASSIHKKVVEEPMTLRDYLRRHPSSVGIRVLRLK